MVNPQNKPKLQKLLKSQNRFALIADDQVVEFIIAPPNHLALGTILTARSTAKAPATGAYFVALPGGKTGFLPTKDKLNLGTKILAVVTKEAHGKKYAKISTVLPALSAENLAKFNHELQSKSAPAVLFAPDLIAELQKIYDISTILTDDMPGAPDPFVAEGIDDELAATLEPLSITAEGIHIFIEKTEAFWAIDVDAGSAAHLSTTEINQLAATRVARQIRQRNLGGQIVIDFISTPKNPLSGKVVATLKSAVKQDPTPTNVVGVTPLGHVELVRHSPRLSLAEGIALLKKDTK